MAGTFSPKISIMVVGAYTSAPHAAERASRNSQRDTLRPSSQGTLIEKGLQRSMTEDIDRDIAIRVIEAFESGRLDYLFAETNIQYFDRADFEGMRFGTGLPRDSIWRLLASVRRATGLVVFESAWGDAQVRVSLTAQLLKALSEIDTWPRRSLFGRSGLPADEEGIIRDRLLVEEATLIGLFKTGADPTASAALEEVRTSVIASVYDGIPPADEASSIATRFYEISRELPHLLNDPPTPDDIRGIHARLRGDAPDAGRFRTAAGDPDGLRSAPGVAPERIEREMDMLCAYAGSTDVPFIHPLIKSIAIAWWIRYVQPFDEYNYLVGRLVSLGWIVHQGYTLLGIADPHYRFKSATVASGDQTAKFIRHLEVIRDAASLGEERLEERVERYASVMGRFGHLDINHRQAFILDRATQRPDTEFTIKHHARTRQLSYETARQDLLRLVEMGYLEQSKRGRAFVFTLSQDARDRLRTSPHSG